MHKELSDHFNSGFMQEKIVRKMELLSLNKYKAAREAFEKYANDNHIEMKDEETSNVYMEMCERKIGNFGHGFQHKITAGNISFVSRLEAYDYYDCSTWGNIDIKVDGPDELVNAVEEAWNKQNKETTWEEINKVIGIYFRNKQHCYGLCRDD
ncbi:MAG: hypothetical protein ACP5NZ_00640 [Nanobdellota archaeon]